MSSKTMLHSQAGKLLTFMRTQELDADVYIKDMYEVATGKTYSPKRHRYAQQRVGALLARIKHHFDNEGKTITTGHNRRTYRVTTTAE